MVDRYCQSASAATNIGYSGDVTPMTGKVVNLGSEIYPHNKIGWTLRFRLGFCLEAIADARLYFLSNTASIGPSGTMLPWRLSDGAYKLAALPPSRNRALGQFSPSRNRRAKASNDTSP